MKLAMKLVTRVYYSQVLAPFFGLASALFTSLFTSSTTTCKSLRKGTPWIKCTVNRAQVAKKRAIAKRRPVRTLARVDRAAVWAENFVGGKFRDITKITKFSTPRKQPAIRYC